MQKIYYLDSIKGQHGEKEDSRDKFKEPWDTINEEQTSKSEIDRIPSWLPSNPPCIQDKNQQNEEDLKVMVEEDMKNDLDKQENQGNQVILRFGSKQSTRWSITLFFRYALSFQSKTIWSLKSRYMSRHTFQAYTSFCLSY